MSETIKPTNVNKKRFPVTTLVEIDDQRIRVGTKDQLKVVNKIRESLQPGTPVYLETINSSFGALARPYTTAAVFLSDGIFANNRFGISQGKHNRAYVQMSSSGDMRTHAHTSDSPYHEGFSVPSSGYESHWNEGTFSPAGGHTSSIYHASGTARLIIGDKVEQLTEALDRIKFAQDALLVSAPNFYSTVGEHILKKCNIKQPRVEADAEKEKLLEDELIAFAVKMLSQAMRRKEDEFFARGPTMEQRVKHPYFQGMLEAREFASYIDGDQPFEVRRKYSIIPSDFAINETQHPRRRIGFLRLGAGATRSALFLPQDRDMERVSKLAFSDDFVKSFYPKA